MGVWVLLMRFNYPRDFMEAIMQRGDKNINPTPSMLIKLAGALLVVWPFIGVSKLASRTKWKSGSLRCVITTKENLWR